MAGSRQCFHQNPLPILTDALTFPDFLKIRPPSFSPPSCTSAESGQTNYEIPKISRNSEVPLTHTHLPPVPNIPLPVPPLNYYETPLKSRHSEDIFDSKSGSFIPSQTVSSTAKRSSGQQSGSNRLSNEISYAQRSGGNCTGDRRSFMRSQNEFSPMHNDLATSLMGSSNDSREDPNRCFQSLYSQGRRPLNNRQKSPPPGVFSRLFNEKTAVIYFICFLLLLTLLTGFFFIIKNTKQYVYSDDDLINNNASPEYSLEFGSSNDYVLPPRQIAYFSLAIQHSTNLALLFNISDSQARFVVYARMTLPPTPTAYSYRRIVTAEHLHHRPLQSKVRRSIASDDNKQFFEETQVRNSLINLEDLQPGKWFFGFLNDNTRPLQIRLIPVSTPKLDHHSTNHGCKFDCFGKGSCIKNQCVCYPGFNGRYCQETLCPILCSNNGVFTNGRCHCHQNFKGAICDEAISGCPNGHCEAIENQVHEALNSNKVLLESTKPEEQMPTIEVNPDPTIEQTDDVNVDQNECAENCNDHGECLDKTCVCQHGWTGDTCSTLACDKNCNSNGQCQLIGDEFKCFCNSTHFGANCEYPLETECTDGLDNDEDGLVDCADSECCSSPHCSNHPLCISDLERFVVPSISRIRPETSFKRQIDFLLSPDSSQKYADLNAFDNSKISVIRGHVLSKKAGPLTGVRVSNLLSPKQGFTLTRSSNGGGFFNFVCNGGNFVRLSLLRHPFGAVERSFYIPTNQIIDVGQIFIDEELEIINNTNLNEQCRSVQIAHNFKPKFLTPSISSNNFNSNIRDGSKLNVEERSLEIRSTIEPSSNIQLIYDSERSLQTHSILYARLLENSPPANLKNVYLKIQIAGRIFEHKFRSKANLHYEFLWDRRNVFGQDVVGLQNAIVETTYEYKDGCKVKIVDTVEIEGRYLLKTSDFGQWTLNIQHSYDSHNRILERGDGQRVYLDKTPFIVRTLIGNQDQRAENCPNCHNQPATIASLYSPNSVLSLSDGSIVFGDHNLIRRMNPNGERIETLLELSANNASNYHLALDPSNNEVFIALQYQVLKLKRMEKIRDAKTNFRVVAGTGDVCETETGCSSGDAKAKSVKFHAIGGINFDKNSGFYLLDGRSIRYINRHGELQNLVTLSDWSWYNELQCPSKFRLELLNLQEPRSLIVDPLTQDLFVLDRNAIYRIDVQQSTVQLIAGKLHSCSQSYEKGREDLHSPQQIAFDPQTNFIYITESDGKQIHCIRRVSANGGKLEDFAGRMGICDCNRQSCPCDEQQNKPSDLAINSLFHNLNGINIDQRGRILVADTANFKIKVLEPKHHLFNRKLGVYQIHSTDANEIYEFDQSGRHLQTKNLFDGQSKYIFSYSTSDGRLVNIKMPHTNITFSTQESNIIVRTSRSQEETTIKMNSVNGDEYQQVYAISTWRGVHGMFEYGSNQFVTKAKIDRKITQIEFDQNGKVSKIEEANADKKVELKESTFDEQGLLHLPIMLNGKEVDIVKEASNELTIKDWRDQKFSTLLNGFELKEPGFYPTYERADHPFSSLNDSFTTRYRFTFPSAESEMPKISVHYDVQTQREQSKSYKSVKLNGQKFINRIFDPDRMNLAVYDPSDNPLLSLQMDSNNHIESVQFGSDSNNNATFTYNEVGQIESLTWLDRSLFSFYDNQHRLTRQVVKGDNIELVRSFQYDSNIPYPNLVRLEDGAEYQLEYESDGHLQSIKTPSGNEHVFSRQNGQEIQRTLPSGVRLKAIYNLDNQLEKFVSIAKAQWPRNEFGQLISLNTSIANFGYIYNYKKEKLDMVKGVESYHSAGYFTQGPIVRGTKKGFGEPNFHYYHSEIMPTYDDAARVVQVTTHFGRNLQYTTINYAYDFLGRLSKLGNALIIRKEHSIQVIHPNFEMVFTYTLDNQLNGITFNGGQTKVSGQFIYNSFSLLNSTLWQSNKEAEQIETFNYKNGKLNGFSLNEDEQEVAYNNDGFVTKIGEIQIEYLANGNIKSFGNLTVSTNELGWIVEQGDFHFAYDALGQLVELTNKAINATFKYIYNEHQQLVQRQTFSPGQNNITFYYGFSTEPHPISHFTFDERVFYAIHRIENRPFLLEQVNGSLFALITDSYGSIQKIISESGDIVESRTYNPFGQANVTKHWSQHLPIGYMGFIEDNGLVFVYDKENKVTRPLNVQTGRFMSTSHAALKSTFDVMQPEFETDLFRFDHGRSLSQLFSIDKKQWLQLAGIPSNHLSVQNNDCNTLLFYGLICPAKQSLNFFDQFFDFDNFIQPFQILAPVL